MFEFGNKSREKLNTAHVDLQKIFRLVIKRTKVDLGISEGYRSKTRQYLLYLKRKTKIDGIRKISKHNKKPSEAVDIYAYHSNLTTRRKLAYNDVSLAYIAGIVDSVAQELFEKGETSHLIRWGGNWDGDGIIALDQDFDDLPHFELIKP